MIFNANVETFIVFAINLGIAIRINIATSVNVISSDVGTYIMSSKKIGVHSISRRLRSVATAAIYKLLKEHVPPFREILVSESVPVVSLKTVDINLSSPEARHEPLCQRDEFGDVAARNRTVRVGVIPDPAHPVSDERNAGSHRFEQHQRCALVANGREQGQVVVAQQCYVLGTPRIGPFERDLA
jgi:hypothetical protein